MRPPRPPWRMAASRAAVTGSPKSVNRAPSRPDAVGGGLRADAHGRAGERPAGWASRPAQDLRQPGDDGAAALERDVLGTGIGTPASAPPARMRRALQR